MSGSLAIPLSMAFPAEKIEKVRKAMFIDLEPSFIGKCFKRISSNLLIHLNVPVRIYTRFSIREMSML
jgi:hypothetical protein